ncbi:MAG: hypothetical protein AB7F40_04495 [Victivallaceae bacterium]
MVGDDCPVCFGKQDKFGKLPECETCEYTESCKFFIDNGNGGDHRSGHVSYERYDYSEEVSYKRTPDVVVDDAPLPDSDDDNVRQIVDYLLDIDNYSAELLSEVLHGGANTSSDLARKFGVSRQAIHRKLVDCCTSHPELRKLFITRLYRCRRILRDSERKCNPNQMEFNFDA